MDRSQNASPAIAAPLPPFKTVPKGAIPASRGPCSVGGGIFFAVILICFVSHLVALFTYAAGTELHSYILLVPLVSAYLIYLSRQELPKRTEMSPRLALPPTMVGVAAVALYWSLSAGDETLSRNDSLALLTFAFVCFLWAGGFFFLGRSWMAAAAFPSAFLIFLVPLPDAAVNGIERISVLGSAEAAHVFFEITGTPILRDGVVFQIPGITLRVAQECSGIRSSWVLFITSLVASHLFLKSPWRRFFLVAFVFPLGILRNGFRISVLGLLCVHIGQHMIDSIIHKRGGPVFFGLSLVPLFLLLWWLRRGECLSIRTVTSTAPLPSR